MTHDAKPLEIIKNETTGMLDISIGDSEGMRAFMDEDGTIWFCLRDVLSAMGTKTRPADAKAVISDLFGDGVVRSYPIQDSLGRTQNATFVADAGTTYLIAQGNTPVSKALNVKIHQEIIPTLRKTGRYEEKPLTREQRIARSLLDAQEVMEEQKAVIENQKKVIKTTGLRLLKTQHQIEAQKPEVDFARTVKRSEMEMGLTQGLKHIGVVKTNLFIKIMKTGEVDGVAIPGLKMLENRGRKNYPMQKPLQKGLMTTKIVPIASGQAFPQTFFTAEGLEHMLNLIKKYEILQQFC